MMNVLFILAILSKDNSIIDIFWGSGFIIITICALILTSEVTLKKFLVASLVATWGLRLTLHIYLRNRGSGEDFRYKNWRNTWKNFYLRSYFQVFMLQGLIMLIISSPVVLILSGEAQTIGFLDILGILIFATGFLFESIGDYQLLRFRKNSANQGRLIKTGLWSYTRHPNYFGEALLWWGIWLMAVSETDSLFTIISPLLITFLLRYVSGVPMLEKKYEHHPEWDEYKKQVPPFIPAIGKLKL